MRKRNELSVRILWEKKGLKGIRGVKEKLFSRPFSKLRIQKWATVEGKGRTSKTNGVAQKQDTTGRLSEKRKLNSRGNHNSCLGATYEE